MIVISKEWWNNLNKHGDKYIKTSLRILQQVKTKWVWYLNMFILMTYKTWKTLKVSSNKPRKGSLYSKIKKSLSQSFIN